MADKIATREAYGRALVELAEQYDFVVLDEAALSPIRDYLAARGRAAGAYPGDDEPLFTSLSPRN